VGSLPRLYLLQDKQERDVNSIILTLKSSHMQVVFS